MADPREKTKAAEAGVEEQTGAQARGDARGQEQEQEPAQEPAQEQEQEQTAPTAAQARAQREAREAQEALESGLQEAKPAPVMSVEVSPSGGAWPVVLTMCVAALLSHLILRMSRAQLVPALKRWLPVAQIGVWGIALVLIASFTLTGLPIEWFYFELVLLVLFTMINLGWLRSVLGGAALTLERKFKPGDALKVGELKGEIVSFGMRTVRMRAVDGTLHDVPNEQMMSLTVANLSGDGSDSACEVEIMVPAHIKVKEAVKLARQAAMLSPLASPRHRPEVFLRSPQAQDAPMQLVIKGYAFDPNYQEHFKSDLVIRLMRGFEETDKG